MINTGRPWDFCCAYFFNVQSIKLTENLLIRSVAPRGIVYRFVTLRAIVTRDTRPTEQSHPLQFPVTAFHAQL